MKKRLTALFVFVLASAAVLPNGIPGTGNTAALQCTESLAVKAEESEIPASVPRNDFSDTEAEEYVIDTAEGFSKFLSEVKQGNTFAGKYVYLDADIDMKWRYISSELSGEFEGVLDGRYYTVYGLNPSYSQSEYGNWDVPYDYYCYGLFYSLSGRVLRLNLCNVNIFAPCRVEASIHPDFTWDKIVYHNAYVGGICINGGSVVGCTLSGYVMANRESSAAPEFSPSEYVGLLNPYSKTIPVCSRFEVEEDYPCKYSVTLKDDLNNDGELTTADAVVLQKYLLGMEELEQDDLKNADFILDHKINGFDLAELKRQLVRQA